MAETDLHRSVMFVAIETLKTYYTGQRVYVSGNILLYYQPGEMRRHVSPDVLVVEGLEQRHRENYLLWEEGRAPKVVIEVTSRSTRKEDLKDKRRIYQDEIRVAEYFLFDPRSEYRNTSLQGHRLNHGRYEPILPVSGRLPSLELGLHLETDGDQLRFYDPVGQCWLPTPTEVLEQKDADLEQKDAVIEQKDAVIEQKDAALQRQQTALEQSEAARRRAEAETERLRQQLAALRRQA